MENQQVNEADHGGHEHPETGPIVTVVVDDVTKTVHRGSHLVSELKDELGVDASLQLAEVIDGQLTGLDDGARVVIKGSEVFFTRVRKGSSS
jgi:hypothetical protein